MRRFACLFRFGGSFNTGRGRAVPYLLITVWVGAKVLVTSLGVQAAAALRQTRRFVFAKLFRDNLSHCEVPLRVGKSQDRRNAGSVRAPSIRHSYLSVALLFCLCLFPPCAQRVTRFSTNNSRIAQPRAVPY